MLANGGTAIMTRLDNNLAEWWNPAQDRLLASSAYKRICDDLKYAHGKYSIVIVLASVSFQITDFLWQGFINKTTILK